MPRAAKFSIGGEWGQFSYIDVHAHTGAREMTSIEASHPHCPPSPDAGASDMTAAAGFGLAWPPVGYANRCGSYSSKPTAPPQDRPCGLTGAHGDTAHADAWDDAEIEAFTARTERFARLGRADGDDLAERLTLRDRDGDDRRCCLECSWLGDSGRCLAAATGRIPGADRRLEPVQTVLQRCLAFGLRKGLV